MNRDVSAHRESDMKKVAPPVSEWSDEWLKELVKDLQSAIIIPLIDPELPFWSRNRQHLNRQGIQVWVSGEQTLQLCLDKRETRKFWETNRFNHPKPLEKSGGVTGEKWVAKPVFGHSGKGIFPDRFLDSDQSIYNETWLNYFLNRDDYIVEEQINGTEISVDVLVGSHKEVVCAVPRYRNKVIGGEVVESETFEDPLLDNRIRTIVEKLPDPFGPLNIQCILDRDGEYFFTEINPRFGGGVPLSIAAGADIPGWMISHNLNVPFDANRMQWQPGYKMSRYYEGYYFGKQK